MGGGGTPEIEAHAWTDLPRDKRPDFDDFNFNNHWYVYPV